MEAGFGSTMPRYSVPSAYPHAIEFLGEHGLDLVAVMQRGAGVGHDDFAHIEAFKNFGGSVGRQSDPHFPRLNGIAFDHLNGQPVNGGMRHGNAATALGVDIGAGGETGHDDRPDCPGCCGGALSRASSWLSVTMSPSRTNKSVTFDPSWSAPTTASRFGTTKPVTLTMSEKQALTVLATMTSACPAVSLASGWERCSNE